MVQIRCMITRTLLLLLLFGSAWALKPNVVSRGQGKMPEPTEDIEEPKDRRAKVFSVFQVVRFSNAGCTGGSGKSGTCYTAEECNAKGGANSGSCAQGYGVCCVFSLTCGGSSSQNCTFFEVSGATAGTCSISICKCNSNICQLRLDFNTFVIAGPSTLTTAVTQTINGSPAPGGAPASSSTACLTDIFTVTSPGNAVPPVICGTNTGQHMYLDPSDVCNTLAFELGQTATGTSIPNRQWSIKITQLSCDFNNLAPPGCTQYFFGAQSQCVQTYNFAGGVQLNNQNQNICVRICWSTATPTDFQVSGSTVDITNPASCCRYGTGVAANLGKKSYDCLTIPGAQKTNGAPLKFSRICGRSQGLVTAASAAATAKTICSKIQPFSIRFLSDMYDLVAENTGATAVTIPSPKGVKLCYIEDAKTC